MSAADGGKLSGWLWTMTILAPSSTAAEVALASSSVNSTLFGAWAFTTLPTSKPSRMSWT